MAVEVVLIGPPGAGKSSIAKTLAKRTGKRFLDTDSMIEAKTGKRIPEIFLDEGEEKFRQYEEGAVLEALLGESEIVALGGGAVMSNLIQERLTSVAPVIFLDVSISNAAPRVGFNRDRPLLLGNPRAQWLALMEKRRPIYERLASITVCTDNKKPEEVVSEILELISL